MRPYFDDGTVQLWHGDAREITDWLAADVLVCDPPYGRGWNQGWTRNQRNRAAPTPHLTIAGDKDTAVRDSLLTLWGSRLAAVFGDLVLPPPPQTCQVLIYHKSADSGTRGTRAGFRRDVEAIYLTGPWPPGLNGRSSVLTTLARMQGGRDGTSARHGHPHAKPLDVMEQLIAACPAGVIADPCAGSGSTLVAARNQGRRAIGVELEERWCERAARRLSQGVLDLEAGAA